jgi:putative lipoic acid-binding regulatory protein
MDQPGESWPKRGVAFMHGIGYHSRKSFLHVPSFIRLAQERWIAEKNMTDENECKPELAYPSPWVYKVIGRDRELLRSAVAEILSGQTYSAILSRSSKGGAYHCLNIEMTVGSELDRLGFYEQLRRHPAVIMVL